MVIGSGGIRYFSTPGPGQNKKVDKSHRTGFTLLFLCEYFRYFLRLFNRDIPAALLFLEALDMLTWVCPLLAVSPLFTQVKEF
jgi:hypothetical protein